MSSPKKPPCPIGQKHKWTGNNNIRIQGKLVGIWKCACGLLKTDAPKYR